MHTISSYRGNRLTNTHTHRQTGPITIHCAAKLSAQCNEKLARGLRKKALDFSGNPDHVTLGLGKVSEGLGL